MKGLNGIIIRVSGVRVPPPLLVPAVASGRTTPPKSATGRDLGGFVCARARSEASQRLARSGRVSSPARCIWRCIVEDVTDGMASGPDVTRVVVGPAMVACRLLTAAAS